MKRNNFFINIKSDFSSGLVVFLVALPLCLAIAMASGASLFSGIISGIIGGIVVGYLSGSHVSVSGPAAGLTAIVLTAILDLGAFNIFLTAVFLAGLIQIALGFLKVGTVSNYFPMGVIEGMLSGIGIIIILKQIPHIVGFDNDYERAQYIVNSDDSTIWTLLSTLFDHIQLGSIIITFLSLVILIVWDNFPVLKKLKLVPGALVATIISIVLNEIFISVGSPLAIYGEHLVSLPVPSSLEEFENIVVTPNFSGIFNPQVWVVAVTLAVVASIETLLCIEAADTMDVQKRNTNTNKELKAQGVGNILSSLLGGLPMTSVVVRSSVNIAAGAKTKMSAIIHGLLLLISVFSIPALLNKTPLATLAAILLLVGYKLLKPFIFIHFWKKGKYQFAPFIITLLGVVFLDLLKGIALGIIVSIIFILRGNLKRAYFFKKEKYKDGDLITVDLAQEVSFLNKAAIKMTLAHLPKNSKVVINASDTVYIAHDILDLIKEFTFINAKEKNIEVSLMGFKEAYELTNTDNIQNHVIIEYDQTSAISHIATSSHKEVITELTKEK